MNIGFISTRFSGVDGVSLETQKMAHIFRQMGHNTFFCAGALDGGAQPGYLVPAMHFNDAIAETHHDEAFTNLQPSREFFMRLYEHADMLRGEIEKFINQFDIDILVPQNALTIPMNIALGIAIGDVIRRHRIKTIAHHHDFYWERERFIPNDIQDVLNEAFPPMLQPIVHVVINKAMKRRLRAFKGIDAFYLPNVFDYETPPPEPDAYSQSFRETIGLSDDDIIALQPTRIVRRKGIELAIEIVRRLNDERIVLVITGYEGDERDTYGSWIRAQADQSGIRYKIIGDYVGSERGEVNGHNVYTLWDIYPHAQFITYPSLYEGFGNALLETVYFRKPFVVNQYATYLTDIKPAGIRAVELSNYDINDDVVRETRRFIEDPAYVQELVDHNYKQAQTHFSYAVLRRVLEAALEKLDEV
jgi:glycosyltransferase involved in cell wall biosynthesis